MRGINVTCRDCCVLIGLRVENYEVVEAKAFMDLALIRSSTPKNHQETAETLEAVANPLAKIKAFSVGLIDAPLHTVTFTRLERSHVVTCFSSLSAPDEKFKPY